MKYIRLKKIFICCFCIIISISCSYPLFSYATTQDDYDSNNAELENLRSKQKDINESISNLNTQIETAGNELASIEVQLSEKQTALLELQSQIDLLNNDISQKYDTMKLRIQYMYEHNSQDTIDLLLSSTSLAEMLVRTEYVSKISEYDKNMLEQLNNLMITQNNNKAELEKELETLNTLKADAQSKTASLNSLLEQAKNEYESNSNDIEKSEALALQYEAKLEEERISREQSAIDTIKGTQETSHLGTVTAHTDTDLAMLAAIIECEAGNQPYEGLIAVGSVVINRVLDSRFSNSISGVIYAPYQFSPVASGRFSIVLARGANSRCIQAANEVLNGNLNTNALYFHIYNSSVDSGGTVIGDHVFY